MHKSVLVYLIHVVIEKKLLLIKKTKKKTASLLFFFTFTCYTYMKKNFVHFFLGIHLQFLNFSTEAIHDYLEIRSGTLEMGSVIDRFSSPVIPKPLFSTTHQTTFFFHSDYSQNKPGFHITYQGKC